MVRCLINYVSLPFQLPGRFSKLRSNAVIHLWLVLLNFILPVQSGDFTQNRIQMCDELKLYDSFKTQFMVSNGINTINGEETIVRIDSELQIGRLKHRRGMDNFEFYYSTDRNDVIHFDPNSLNCDLCKINRESDFAEGIGDIGFISANQSSIVVGPTAIWNKVIESKWAWKDRELSSWMNISAIKCTKHFDHLFAMEQVDVNVYLADPEWMFPTEVSNAFSIPLAIEMKGSMNGNCKQWTVNYHLFEEMASNDYFENVIKLNGGFDLDSVWHLPQVGCPALAPSRKMPSFAHSFGIEWSSHEEHFNGRLTIEQLAWDADDELLMVFDSPDQYYIVDVKHSFECFVEHTKHKAAALTAIRWKHIRSNLMVDLLTKQNFDDYEWIGQSVENGLICQMYQRQMTIDGVLKLHTYCLHKMKLVWTVVKMLENVIENKQVENSNYKTIKLLISTETFNYHSLPLDLDIEQKFNVRRCFANDQDSIPITVTISLKNTFGGVLKKYNTQGNILFKNNLKQMLAEIGECSSMQLTDFNYNHDLETIDVDVTLRNIQKVQVYFKETFQQLDRDDLSPRPDTLEGCMYHSLNDSNVYGFSMCELNMCYLVQDPSLLTNPISSEETNKERTLNSSCRTFTKLPIPNNQADIRSVQRVFALLRQKILSATKVKQTLYDGNVITFLNVQRQHHRDESLFNPSSSLAFQGQKLTDSIVHDTFSGAESRLRSIHDCSAECERMADTDPQCRIFSFCQEDAFTMKCLLSDLTKQQLIESNATNEQSLLVTDQRCSTFEMLYLNKYDVQPGTSLRADERHVLEGQTLEDCARQCTSKQADESNEKCLSFAFCNSYEDNHADRTLGRCVMYSEHKFLSTNTSLLHERSCDLHSANFLNDYYRAKIRQSLKFGFVSFGLIESCSLACTLDSDCQRFLFCPFNPDNDLKTEKGECRMEKRNQIDVEPNSQKMKSTDVKDSGSQTCLLMVRKAHPPMVPQTIKAKVETSISELNVLQQKMSILDQLSGHFAMYVTLLVISLTVTLLISLKREFERIKRDNGIRIKYEKHEDKVQETAE